MSSKRLEVSDEVTFDSHAVDWSEAPEGATHYGRRCKGYNEKWYKLDGDKWSFHVWNGMWVIANRCEDGGFENLTPRPVVTTKWKPEVGETVNWDMIGLLTCVVTVVAHAGDNDYVVTKPDHAKIVVNLSELRPHKTEADVMFDIVKNAVDLYQACELLVEAGYSK